MSIEGAQTENTHNFIHYKNKMVEHIIVKYLNWTKKND